MTAALVADLGARLAGWAAPDADQERLRTAYLHHLEHHPDAVLKSGPPAHFTASCLVIDSARDRVLLTLHRRARRWFQFGGHLEVGDASVAAAATREAREESGLPALDVRPQIVQLDRHTLVGDFGRCREHLDVRFVGVAGPGAEPVVSEESLDVRWWPVDGLPDDCEPGLRRLVTLARATR